MHDFTKVWDALPPHAVEAECALLGAILVDHTRLGLVVPILPSGEWFMRPKNGVVYDAMLTVADRSGGLLDIVLVNQHLEDTGDIKRIGSLDYLVWLVQTFPSATHAVYYARAVRDKHLVFQAMQSLGDMLYHMQTNPGSFRKYLSEGIRELILVRERATKFAPADPIEDGMFNKQLSAS